MKAVEFTLMPPGLREYPKLSVVVPSKIGNFWCEPLESEEECKRVIDLINMPVVGSKDVPN